MSDIIREIDEDLRRDRLQKLWERYSGYLVGAVLLVVLATIGGSAWHWYQTRETHKAAARFQEILLLLNEGRRFEAEAELNALAKTSTAGYRLLARFRIATEVAKNNAAAGVAAYDALAEDRSLDPVLRDLAKVHAALFLVDTASVSEIARRMEPLITPASPFRHSAREILGLAHYRAGQRETAAKIFAEILTDPDTPPVMRERAGVLRTLLSAAASPAGQATQ